MAPAGDGLLAADAPAVREIKVDSLGPLVLIGDNVGWVDLEEFDPYQWDSSRVMVLDPDTNKVTDTDLFTEGVQLASSGDKLWATTTHATVKDSQVVEETENPLQRIDLQTGEVEVNTTLNGKPTGIAIVQDSVWISNSADDFVWRIDHGSGRVAEEINVGAKTYAIFSELGYLFFLQEDEAALLVVDPATGRRVTEISSIDCPVGVTSGVGSIWVSDCGGEVVRLDPATWKEQARIAVPSRPGSLRYALGRVWIAHSSAQGLVTRIDPSTNQLVGDPIEVGGHLQDIVVTHGSIWIASEGDEAGKEALIRLDP